MVALLGVLDDLNISPPKTKRKILDTLLLFRLNTHTNESGKLPILLNTFEQQFSL